jgi:CRP/FNR family transcriptional regulator
LSKIFKDGNEQILRILYPGQILGYRSVLLQRPYGGTAITLKSSHLCAIPSDLFLRFVHENPKIAYEMMRQACEDLGTLQNRVAHMGYKNVVEKVAEALIYFSEHNSHERNVVEISREDLAQFMGIARETVSRVISEFKSERLIDVKGRRIILLNRESLYRLAHLYD